MKVLIVDDEPLARDRLRRMLEEIDDVQCAGEAGTGIEALAMAQTTSPDVVLLDIRMPGMDGVETAQHLGQLTSPPAVIFTTAYDEYALRAFDAQAVGYLLKPVRKEKLSDILARAAKPTKPQLAALAAGTAGAESKPRRSFLSVRRRGELRLIPLEEVVYCVAEQKYVTVYHSGGEDLIEDSLKSLEEEFAAELIRIHRNTLVAVRHIAAIERTDDEQYVLRLRDASLSTLPISRRLYAEVLRRFRG